MKTVKEKYVNIFSNRDEFLSFLNLKFKLFHWSNVFFRDIHYGVWEYLERHGVSVTYGESEELTYKIIVLLEKEAILKRIDERTWLLNYPQFKLMPVQKIQMKLPSAA